MTSHNLAVYELCRITTALRTRALQLRLAAETAGVGGLDRDGLDAEADACDGLADRIDGATKVELIFAGRGIDP